MASNLEKALGFNLEAFNYLYVLCDYETLLKKNITLENFLEILKKPMNLDLLIFWMIKHPE